MHLSRMPENKCVLQQASQEVPQIFAACTLLVRPKSTIPEVDCDMSFSQSKSVHMK